jgi:hypothetical protein
MVLNGLYYNFKAHFYTAPKFDFTISNLGAV